MSVSNFRSIKSLTDLRIEPLQALVGENNTGKSNILRALNCLLSAGAGGAEVSDLPDQSLPAIIEAEFRHLSDEEKNHLRSYLIGDKLIVQKRLTVELDERSGKTKLKSEYHGYQAEPRDWHLSIAKIEEKGKPDWKKIAAEFGLIEYVQTEGGKVTKASYQKGLGRYLSEHVVEFDEPELGKTQALGIAQNLLTALPRFYLLPAITDYSDEIDRRSSSTVFRRLMADLSDRLIKADARYSEVESTLATLRGLLNPPTPGTESHRLAALESVERLLYETLKPLMPSVMRIHLNVDVEESRELFSRGVGIRIDDGVLTDVLDKGHGMQRTLVFALLRMLMKSSGADAPTQSIILGIEEPELYIHPHAQRLIFGVLRKFAGLENDEGDAVGGDQVIYTTHSPAFIDISHYERIGVVRKLEEQGTKVLQCSFGVLGTVEERKGFKLLTCFGLKHNELFFARRSVIVEGPEDEIGIIATARKLGRIIELPDEIGLSIVVADGKGDIVKFQKILNAFGLQYGVLLELDGRPEAHPQTAPIMANLKGNQVAIVPNRLEDLLGVGRHFDDQRHAKEFFSDPNRINAAMEAVVTSLFPPL
jgi:CRISPR-associated exonuclease Cas4